MFSESIVWGVGRSSSTPLQQNESSLGVTYFSFWCHLDHARLSVGDAFGLERSFCWQQKKESLASSSFLLVLDNVEG